MSDLASYIFLLGGESSIKSFNSFSKLSKSSTSISLLLFSFFLSFINNSIPSPKLDDFFPELEMFLEPELELD